MEWEQVSTSRAFWAAVLAFRLWNALFVRTVFSPDEFWQSAEVAHRLAFGYGHLCVDTRYEILLPVAHCVLHLLSLVYGGRMDGSTWEWGSDAQIRGFAHPGVFALLYKALALLVRSAETQKGGR